MKKPLIVFGVILVILASLGLFATKLLDRQKTTTQTTTKAVDVTGSTAADQIAAPGLVIGQADAPISIIEYSDYKCPKCNDFHQKAYKSIRKEWVDTGKAKIVFRPFPVFGEDSGLALYASYCAADQGKFAEYHDKMFDYMWSNHYHTGEYDATTEKLFSPAVLGKLAADAGLDQDAFTACAGGTGHGDAYNADVLLAASDSVQGTPTLVIGGQKVVGSQPYGVYKVLLETQK